MQIFSLRYAWLLLLVGVGLAAAVQTANAGHLQPAQPDACRVSAHYAEALNENTTTLLKLLAIANGHAARLTTVENFGSYFAMLASTRHYHEAQHAELPACAQPLNLSLLRTIGATQDVMALQLALTQTPAAPRAEARLAWSIAHLNAQWAHLARLEGETALQVTPE